MAKTDIESAFRFFPVHPHDWKLLGMSWNGFYYFDEVLPFGLRSAPLIFNQLSDAIVWLMQNKCAISFECLILNVFLKIEPPAPTALSNSLCLASLSNMILFKNLLKHPHFSTQNGGSLQNYVKAMGIILDSAD